MKLSKLNIKKINFNDIDTNYSGQDILMKLGELYQFESGIYGYGNIWTKLEKNIEKIIIEELDKIDCIQVEFPKLQPRSIWNKSNRWNQFTEEKDIMFTLNNNLGEYGLAPTGEECATIFGSNRLLSYKQIPTTYYQIGEKFRKEKRARGYLFPNPLFLLKKVGISNSLELFSLFICDVVVVDVVVVEEVTELPSVIRCDSVVTELTVSCVVTSDYNVTVGRDTCETVNDEP